MSHRRRSLIRMAGVAAAGAATGCLGGEGEGNGETEGNQANGGGGTADEEGREEAEEKAEETSTGGVGAETAVAAEWNRMRVRLYDPVAFASAGATDTAAGTAQEIFARFEGAGGEYGAHEALEETDAEAYEGFEEALGALRQAVEEGDVETAREEAGRADEHLASAQRAHVSENDAYALDLLALGTALSDARIAESAGGDGSSVATSVFSRFETADAHDPVEEANSEAYESFESSMSEMANGNVGAYGDTVKAAVEGAYSVADNEETVGAGHLAMMSAQGYDAALVGESGGDGSSVMSGVFGRFEQARVHEMVEEASTEAYEGFESALDGYITALNNAEGVREALGTYADATLYACFAVAGAEDDAPVDETSSGDGHGGGTELTGGPNVYEGEPDADHVVDSKAVVFEPETLEVSQGDTVAWVYTAGEPHSVTAYGDGIPDDAEYWASGGFSSEEEAREGWENGKGAITEGTYYEHTFETKGTHEYVCIPHEMAGMVGEVVVE